MFAKVFIVIMKRLLGFTFVLMTLGFMSCSPSPVGSWVQSTGGSEEVGFTLYQDGSASSINMGYVEFKAWEKNGDLLILKGNNVGSFKREFSDTMKIVKITKTDMSLSQAGYSDILTYVKK